MSQKIIMNFSTPPSLDDIRDIAQLHLDNLPEELADHCLEHDITLQIEDIPDEATENDLELSDPYELLCLYKSAKEVTPGVERKNANDNDVIILYRRPLLDVWSETGDHLSMVIREAVIGELGTHLDFSDDDIEEMTQRHFQGVL